MTRLLPSALLVLLGIIWGSNFLFMKLAVAHMDAVDVAWFRTLFGAAPILLCAFALRLPARRDWKFAHHFAAMALLANVGPYLFFVIGTDHLPSGVAGVISGSIPCMTAAIVALALPEEVLRRGNAIGLALGFAGVVLVTPDLGATALTGSGTSLIGAASMIAGSISYALALVYARHFVQRLKINPVSLAAYQMVLASIFMGPFADAQSFPALAARPAAMWGLIVGLGLVGTGIAFVIYYYLVGRLGALKAASVYYIPPGVALLMGALFRQEHVGGAQIAGALLIGGGIYYAIRREDHDQPHRLRVHQS